MTSPAHLDAAAAGLRGQAAGLAALLDPAVGRAGTNVWQGPAQQQLWDRLLGWRLRLAGAQGELYAVAGALEAEAVRIRGAEAAAAAREPVRRRVS